MPLILCTLSNLAAWRAFLARRMSVGKLEPAFGSFRSGPYKIAILLSASAEAFLRGQSLLDRKDMRPLPLDEVEGIWPMKWPRKGLKESGLPYNVRESIYYMASSQKYNMS